METSTKSKNYSKRYRQKLKSDSLRLEISREKAKERASRYRKKLLESNDFRVEKAKEQNLKRQQRFRLKKKNEVEKIVNLSHNQPYRNKKTLGNALKKVETALPVDPVKRAHIVDILYKKHCTYGSSSLERQTESAVEEKK